MNSQDQSLEENELLQLNPKQRYILEQLLLREVGKLLSIKFDNQNEDHNNMRLHSYLLGGKDIYTFILDYDNKILKAREAEKRERMGASDQPTDSFQPVF